jgi:hypothetical protein
MDVFVNERLRYAINMVATSERHVLPKPIPLHRSQRSPSSEGSEGGTAAEVPQAGTHGS